MKNVEIPPTMQRAMAQEAEALREKRARLIKAEAELDAAEQLRNAAEVIMQNPAGLELRRMQMITEVGAEQNTMTIIMMPSEFVAMAKGIAEMAAKVGESGNHFLLVNRMRGMPTFEQTNSSALFPRSHEAEFVENSRIFGRRSWQARRIAC